MAKSPISIPYTSDSVEMGVKDGASLPGNIRGFVSVGYDGTNTRFIRVDTGGHQFVLSNQLPNALVGGRLDAHIGSWFGATTPTVGQKTMVASIPIAIASDQTVIPVSQNGPPWSVGGYDADGVQPTKNPVLMAGFDGINVKRIRTNSAGRPQHVLYDDSGNAVGVVLDGSIYRLLTRGKVSLFDASDVDMAVELGTVIPANTRGLLSVGEDETGKARVLRSSVDGSISIVVSEGTAGAFGELRTATSEAAANIINKYEIDPKDLGTSLSGSGTITHIPAESAIKLQVTGASGDKARIRTHTYFRYQAGKGTRVLTTAYHADTGRTNQIRRWGMFDDNDGIFFELNGTTLSAVIRSSTSGSPVETKVAQADWNYDTMDGEGPSEVALDITKGQIWEIQFQWLGVGKVNFYINGILCHVFDNPNHTPKPYMKTAVLPLSWEIENVGSSTGSYFISICTSVNIEGTQQLPEYSFGAYNSADIPVSTVERPLLSIRPSLTYNGIENRMSIFPILLGASNEGGRAALRMILDATLVGASWTAVGGTSSVEYDETATSFSGGTHLLRLFLPGSSDSIAEDINKFFAALGRALRREAFGTAVRSLTLLGKYEKSAGSTAMRASLTWGESR